MTILFLLACNLGPAPIADKTAVDDTSGTTDDSGTVTGPTIFDLRAGDFVVGQIVALEGVVVSSPHTDGDEGFFVQDPAGGPNSGIYVWGYDGVATVYAEPGDEVTVTGTPQDYNGWLELVIDSASDVVETGTATLPPPVDLGDGAGVDWEAYESVPVTLTGQTVESVDDWFAGALTAGLNLDDGFVRLQYDCRGVYAAITGVVFYEWGAWTLNARSESDAVGYVEPETIDATLRAIQEDGVCGPVRVEGLVATTGTWSDEDGSYFFAQDAGGGEWSGALLFQPESDAGVVTGEELAATGSVTQYFGMTEVRLDTFEVTGAGEPVVDTLTAAPDDWEPWEGCLVRIEDVEVTGGEDPYGQVTTSWDGLLLDDLLYDFTVEEGDHWDAVVGPIFYSYEEWKLLPRGEADFIAP